MSEKFIHYIHPSIHPSDQINSSIHTFYTSIIRHASQKASSAPISHTTSHPTHQSIHSSIPHTSIRVNIYLPFTNTRRLLLCPLPTTLLETQSRTISPLTSKNNLNDPDLLPFCINWLFWYKENSGRGLASVSQVIIIWSLMQNVLWFGNTEILVSTGLSAG